MKGSEALRVALYIRVSTDEQAESGYSVGGQKRELLDHAEQQGWVVVDTVVDDGYSGAVGIRPGLDRITKLAEAGEIDVILAKKRNRLFRDRYIRMGYERSMKEHGVRLVALDDTGHRFADAMTDEFEDWYREEMTKNVIVGRMDKAREGKLIRSRTPIYGFAYTPEGESYTVVPESMSVVERIIRMVSEGKALHAAKKELEANGIPAPNGGELWRISTIRDIVREDAYRPVPYPELEPMFTPTAKERCQESAEYGIVWYPRRKVTRLDPDPTRGYRRPQRATPHPREEQVPIPVVSSRIPRELIDTARERLKGNRPSRSNGHRVYQLAGFARCAECGCRMSTNRQLSASGKGYFNCRCPNYMRNGTKGCTMNTSYPAEELERAVIRAVLDAVKDRDELKRKAEENFKAERARLTRLGGTDTKEWYRRLDTIERRKARAQHAYMEEAISLEDLRARTAEMDREKAHVERLLQEYENRAAKLRELEATRDRTIDLIDRGEWGKLGITAPEARKERYREIGLSVALDADKNISLEWNLGKETLVRTNDTSSWGGARTKEVARG